MITKEELQRKAAQAGVRVQLQERDYALGWFLLGLAQEPSLSQGMAFKGGTALRKTYFPDYRFSEDLDFTLMESMGMKDLQPGVESVLRQIKRASGMHMWIAKWKVKREVVGEEAYQARVAYVGPLGQSTSPPRIRLDLTRYECLVLSPMRRVVTHSYSDAPSGSRRVLTYRLEEMLAEKLRALLRRCYPRDVYDVWYLLRYYGERLEHRDLLQALEAKCHYKAYTFSSPEDFLRPTRRAGMPDAWNSSLKHLVSSVPSYESVVNDLQDLLGWL